MRDHGAVVARAVLAAVAVLVLAWVGVLMRDFEVARIAGNEILHGRNLSDARFDRDIERVEAADFLTPDATWEQARAQYYFSRGRLRQAARVAEALVRREPENIEAWVVLFRANQEIDPRRSARAEAEVKRLDPFAGSRSRR
jgi:tetratricopeptide repeat protein